MFDTRTRLFLFACLKGAAGTTLKRRLRLSATTNTKISSGAALKVEAPGGSGSATLIISVTAQTLVCAGIFEGEGEGQQGGRWRVAGSFYSFREKKSKIHSH